MLPFIIAYILIVAIWGALSLLAVRQVYQYVYRTDKLSRTITMVYLIASLAIAINGFRLLLALNFDQLFL